MKRFYFGIGAVLSFVGGLVPLGCFIGLPHYDFRDANQASQGIGGLALASLILLGGIIIMKRTGGGHATS